MSYKHCLTFFLYSKIYIQLFKEELTDLKPYLNRY